MYSKFRAIQGYRDKKISEMVNMTYLLKNKSNERILDILINKQLYASKFEELNDIKEGLFYFMYTIGSNVDNILECIRYAKNEYRICSFSKTPIKSKDNIEKDLRQHLMWVHYAGNHNGIRIDFDIDNSKDQKGPFKIKYTNKEEGYEFIKKLIIYFMGQMNNLSLLRKFLPQSRKFGNMKKRAG